MGNGVFTTTARTWSGLLLTALFLQGCAGSGHAPVDTRGIYRSPVSASAQTAGQRSREEHSAIPASGYHVVSRGDTLYAIAWRYRLDYRDVARWNGIRPPYVIYPGDKIRLHPRAEKQRQSAPLPQDTASNAQVPSPPLPKTTKAPSPPLDPSSSRPVTQPAQLPKSEQPQQQSTVAKAPAAKKTAAAPSGVGPVKWSWPTRGQVLSSNSPTAEKGIKIGGRAGQEIHAAAPGQVVYSGSGLIGYGKLIIIKHNDTYLSAYAHNSELLVKEGDSVNGGQQIATMGAASDGRAALHFEIRRNGQPINPLEHLPKRQG